MEICFIKSKSEISLKKNFYFSLKLQRPKQPIGVSLGIKLKVTLNLKMPKMLTVFPFWSLISTEI